jgi:membrane glycosyltransferase
MRPLHGAILLFLIVFIGSLLCYGAAIGGPPAGAGFVWFAWRAAGAGCLSSTAVELVVFFAWLWQKIRGVRGDGGVPLHLSAADRRELVEARPTVAMLMPAHNEASTPDDRDALIERIHDILMRTPDYAVFFLLADSPASQRDNELAVIAEVKRRLRTSGHGHWQDRLVLEEYRDKPPSWRHKCGSLLKWIQRFGDRYEFMFILDADSSLGVQDPARPQTCDVLARMLVAMRRDPTLAMVQATIEITNHQSTWGWIQAINTRMGANYYLRVFSYLYGRAAPCYGHNCLMRVSDFATHATNTLSYTSHDHVDSSDWRRREEAAC